MSDMKTRLALIRAKECDISKVSDADLTSLRAFVKRTMKILDVLYFGDYVGKTRELRIDFHVIQKNVDKEFRIRNL